MVDSCIDDTTMDYYYNIVAIFEGSPDAKGDWLSAVGDGAHVIANLGDCNFR